MFQLTILKKQLKISGKLEVIMVGIMLTGCGNLEVL